MPIRFGLMALALLVVAPQAIAQEADRPGRRDRAEDVRDRRDGVTGPLDRREDVFDRREDRRDRREDRWDRKRGV